MLHCNFKERSHQFNLGVGRCPCDQTFDFTSERDLVMKLRMHCEFCSKPPGGSKHIRTPKKATMLKKQQLSEAEKNEESSREQLAYLSNWDRY